MSRQVQTVRVHLASGIGNIVLATPLLVALAELGLVVDVLLDADYRETASLLQPWSLIRQIVESPADLNADYDLLIPAIPPFYWPRFAARYRERHNVAARPPDALFYQDEQAYYLSFARSLGYARDLRPFSRLPIASSDRFAVGPQTLVLAPGCKTGEMAAKRWPGYAQLAERFEDVVVVGTAEDAAAFTGESWRFPGYVRSFLGKLRLRETAELLASAGVVVANDSGLAHIAVAVGTPTLLLFGPTPDRTLGPFPPNARVLRRDFACAPCWHGNRLAACHARVDCLNAIQVGEVERAARELLGQADTKENFPWPETLANSDRASAEPDLGTDKEAEGTAPGEPLVTCIMPTAGRPRLVAQSIRYFQRQDYPNRELLILDDGADSVAGMVPPDHRIRYVRLDGARSLGAKRNLACDMAAGEIVAHWDDDDWSAPHRLSLQVRALQEHPSAGLCGLARLYFLDPINGRAWLYEHPSGQRPWVAGGTMCYRKEFWRQIRFPDVTEGEDTRFVWADRSARILTLQDPSFYVATVHAHNTSPKHTFDSRWRSCTAESIGMLLGSDWAFYADWAVVGVERAINRNLSNDSLPGAVSGPVVGREGNRGQASTQ